MVAHRAGVALLAVAAAARAQLGRGPRAAAGSARRRAPRRAAAARLSPPSQRRRLPAVEQLDHRVDVVDLELAADVGAAEPELARRPQHVGGGARRAHVEGRPARRRSRAAASRPRTRPRRAAPECAPRSRGAAVAVLANGIGRDPIRQRLRPAARGCRRRIIATMASAGPLPSDIQPVANETRDRIITGLVTLIPVPRARLRRLAGLGQRPALERRLPLPRLYLFTGLGITVGFHRHLTHRASRRSRGCAACWRSSARPRSRARSSPGSPTTASTTPSPTRRATRTAPTSTTATAGAAPCAASSTPTWAGSSSTPSAATRSASRRTCSRTRSISWVDRTFLFWAILGLLLPFALGWVIGGTLFAGLTGLLWGGLVRVFVLHHFTYSINSLCHVFGKRDFETDDHSRNLALIAIPTFGEAWHNNHHAFPTSAIHGLRRWQLDISALVIDGLEKTGLVWDVVRVSPERMAAKSAGRGRRAGRRCATVSPDGRGEARQRERLVEGDDRRPRPATATRTPASPGWSSRPASRGRPSTSTSPTRKPASWPPSRGAERVHRDDSGASTKPSGAAGSAPRAARAPARAADRGPARRGSSCSRRSPAGPRCARRTSSSRARWRRRWSTGSARPTSTAFGSRSPAGRRWRGDRQHRRDALLPRRNRQGRRPARRPAAWLDSYAMPPGRPRRRPADWRRLGAGLVGRRAAAAPVPLAAAAAARQRAPRPRRRSRRAPRADPRSGRAAGQDQGYVAMTVADIVAAAVIPRGLLRAVPQQGRRLPGGPGCRPREQHLDSPPPASSAGDAGRPGLGRPRGAAPLLRPGAGLRLPRRARGLRRRARPRSAAPSTTAWPTPSSSRTATGRARRRNGCRGSLRGDRGRDPRPMRWQVSEGRTERMLELRCRRSVYLALAPFIGPEEALGLSRRRCDTVRDRRPADPRVASRSRAERTPVDSIGYRRRMSRPQQSQRGRLIEAMMVTARALRLRRRQRRPGDQAGRHVQGDLL